MRKRDAKKVQRAQAAFYVARAAYMAAFSEAAPCLEQGESREALFEIERLIAVVDAGLRNAQKLSEEDQ